MEQEKRDEEKSLIFLRHSLGLVYTLVIFSIGLSTSVYFAMTGDRAESTQFHEAFFFIVYLTGIGSCVALGVYMWRNRDSRYHSQRRQIRMESLSLGHRLAGVAPPQQTDNSTAVAAPSDVRFEDGSVASLPFVAHCGEGFNAYLRAGLALFVAGTVALDLLHMSAPYLDGNKPACTGNPFQTALYACQLLFVVASGSLLAFGHRAIFLQHRGFITALLGHLLTACLCLWAHSSVAEITIAVVLARPLGKTNATATSAALNASAACPNGRAAIDSLDPFLSPAKVEFALLAGPMALQLLAYVGDHRMVEAKQSAPAETNANCESEETGENSRLRQRSNSSGDNREERAEKADWLRQLNIELTVRDLIGPAIGAAAFIVTLAVCICVLSLKDRKAAALAYLIHTALLHLAAIAASVPALCRLRQLEFVSAERHAFDDRLLIAAFLGDLIYCIFMLCALLANAWVYPVELATMEGLAGLLGLGQAVMQAPLLLDGLRRRSSRPDLLEKKPGRGCIAALLGINLALWLLGTFESSRMDGVASELLNGRISVLGYRLVMHIGLPFAILFRFHSSVCCSLIWGKAYTEEEE